MMSLGHKKVMLTLFLLITGGLIFFTFSNLLAGNKQLMSEKMAKQDMKRNLVESVIGYKVKSSGKFGLTEEASYKIKEKASALIKGIKVDKMIYDQKKDIAFCSGHVNLGEVQTVTGDIKSYNDLDVYAYGFGTMSSSSKPPLMALRAALLNAYDEMAATLVGEKITSYSEAENFVLTKDVNHSQVCAAVYGAHIPNPDINSKDRGWGWDEGGNAWVKLSLDLRKAEDILGQRIVYEGPNVIKVIGRGSQTDELEQEAQKQRSLIENKGSNTKYQDLDVPVEKSSERKGQPAKELQAETLEGGGSPN